MRAQILGLDLAGCRDGIRGSNSPGILIVDDEPSRAGAFSIPRQAIFEKQGKKLVYRKNGSKFEPVGEKLAAAK